MTICSQATCFEGSETTGEVKSPITRFSARDLNENSDYDIVQTFRNFRAICTFGHLAALLFFFGHIWHGARTIFRDVFALTKVLMNK
jgi:hypothetical protein